MKVLHVPYTYFPDAVGGTEVFVEDLSLALASLGVESVVCAPGSETRSYDRGTTRVHRIRGEGGKLSVNYCYGEGDSVAASAFQQVLDLEHPQVVHVHAHSPMVSMRLARQVKAAGIPLVFSYHTAAATCQRGTMLRWGEVPCSGRLSTSGCSSCIAHSRGMPKPLARMVGRIPPAVDGALRALDLEGGPWTALRMSGLVARKHAATHAFLHLADTIVAPSPWVMAVLLANGIPERRLFLCGHGVDRPEMMARPRRRPGSALRIIALSRLEANKGLDVLVDAIAGDPTLDVTLDMYGQSEFPEGDSYSNRLRQRIASDSRTRLLPPIPHGEVLSMMSEYDILAVPSQGFETGPLVVLEAFASGTPVLGSNLAGISDRVTDGVDGILVDHDSRPAWNAALRRLASDRELVEKLRAGITCPPSMRGIARRMGTLYESLIAQPPRRSVRDRGPHPARPAPVSAVPAS